MPYRLILTGRVQGVGCRAFCSYCAKKVKVHGAASNLPDGTVEVLLDTGDESMVESYGALLKGGGDGQYHFFGSIERIFMEEYHGPMGGDYRF